MEKEKDETTKCWGGREKKREKKIILNIYIYIYYI